MRTGATYFSVQFLQPTPRPNAAKIEDQQGSRLQEGFLSAVLQSASSLLESFASKKNSLGKKLFISRKMSPDYYPLGAGIRVGCATSGVPNTPLNQQPLTYQ